MPLVELINIFENSVHGWDSKSENELKIYLPTFLEDTPYVELNSQPDDTGVDGGRRSHHRNAARRDHEQGYSWVAES